MFLKKVFRILPQNPFNEGLDLYNEGRFEEAILHLEPLLNSSDEAVRNKASLYACEAHLELGDSLAAASPEQALHHYEAASSLQPRFADIHNKAGEMSRRLGRPQAAEEAFRRALERNPRYFVARLNLAELLVEAGRNEEAVHELTTLQSSCPPLYRERVNDLMGACREGGAGQQQAAFEAVRKLAPTRLERGRQTALTAIRRGDGATAARILVELVKEYPKFPDLRHLLGLAYGEMGESKKAMLEFQKSLEIQPKYIKARINLGIALMEEGLLDEAEMELRRVLEVDPTNPLVDNALAEIAASRTRA